jgi:hypothetical protein
MGLFRPARTVTGPHGEYWELYVSKTALPAWREGAPGAHEYSDGMGGREDLLQLPFMLVSALWGMLIAPLLRFLVLLPVSFVRGRRSRAVRIEAVNAFPHREVFLWTTTDDGVERVLDEIASGLAAGKFAQPEGAVYSGREW